MNTQEFLKTVESIGTRTTYTCPECNGSIWQIGDSEPLMRFRCHIGHSYTANVFLAEQTQNVEDSLWTAVRVMEEKVIFLRHLSEQMKNYNLTTTATKYENNAKNMDEEVKTIRELILNGFATKRSIDEGEEK
jgi:two-component system chemotaxis response regulator CheB